MECCTKWSGQAHPNRRAPPNTDAIRIRSFSILRLQRGQRRRLLLPSQREMVFAATPTVASDGVGKARTQPTMQQSEAPMTERPTYTWRTFSFSKREKVIPRSLALPVCICASLHAPLDTLGGWALGHCIVPLPLFIPLAFPA